MTKVHATSDLVIPLRFAEESQFKVAVALKRMELAREIGGRGKVRFESHLRDSNPGLRLYECSNL